jgi:hypothetical protein
VYYDPLSAGWVPFTVTQYAYDLSMYIYSNANEQFGAAVAVSSSTLAVGAPLDDSEVTSGGVVYIWSKGPNLGEWLERQRIGTTEAGFGSNARFGSGLALSDDGLTLAVGAIGYNGDCGAVRIWYRASTSVDFAAPQSAVLPLSTNPGDEVGSVMQLDATGDLLVVGAPNENGMVGAVYTFTRTAGVWNAAPKLFLPLAQAQFGRSLALSADHFRLAVGGPGDDLEHGAFWSVSARHPRSSPLFHSCVLNRHLCASLVCVVRVLLCMSGRSPGVAVRGCKMVQSI